MLGLMEAMNLGESNAVNNTITWVSDCIKGSILALKGA